MKKINLKGISEILSEKELKNVMGGSGGYGYCYECSYNGNTYSVNVSCDPPTYNCKYAVMDVFADRCPAGGAFWGC
jgi:natural product precursor